MIYDIPYLFISIVYLANEFYLQKMLSELPEVAVKTLKKRKYGTQNDLKDLVAIGLSIVGILILLCGFIMTIYGLFFVVTSFINPNFAFMIAAFGDFIVAVLNLCSMFVIKGYKAIK